MSLIKDQYGNYVVQTALEVADWPVKCVMAEMVRPMLPNIRYTNYGKRIHTKVVSILAELDKNNNNNNNNTGGSHSPSYGSQTHSNPKINGGAHGSNINTDNNLLPGINFSAHVWFNTKENSRLNSMHLYLILYYCYYSMHIWLATVGSSFCFLYSEMFDLTFLHPILLYFTLF